MVYAGDFAVTDNRGRIFVNVEDGGELVIEYQPLDVTIWGLGRTDVRNLIKHLKLALKQMNRDIRRPDRIPSQAGKAKKAKR